MNIEDYRRSGGFSSLSRYRGTGKPYNPMYLPMSFCTAILLSSYAVVDHKAVSKRPKVDRMILAELVRMRKTQKLRRHNHEVPVYLTVGGDHLDSANISKALRDFDSRAKLISSIISVISSYNDSVSATTYFSSY